MTPILAPDKLRWAISTVRASRGDPAADWPEGTRAALEQLITSALIGPAACEEYLAALGATEPAPVRRPVLTEISIDRVLRDGLAALTDDQLERLAGDSVAIRELNRRVDSALFDGTAGPTWDAAEVLPEEVIPPGYGGEKTVDRVVALIHEIERTADKQAAEQNERGASKSVSPSRRWRFLGVAAALAACLLLGVFIGTKIGGRSDRYEFALAAVETRGAGPRGIQDVELVVQNGGDARAFVTVVGVFPERKRAVVFYRTGDTFVTAAPNGKTPVKNLPPEFEGATIFVVVVTGVPAGEAIRMSLPATVSAAEVDTFAEGLGRSLEALSVRSERRVVAVPAGKN